MSAASQPAGNPAVGRALEGRIALVTGASRGIGGAVCRRFAAEGATVIAVARTQGGLEELDDSIRSAGNPPPVLVPLDLKAFDALDRLGSVINDRFGRLDILVGNAGLLGPMTPVAQIEPKQWQEVIDVNVTANWRLIRSMDPLLRRSSAARVVFVTSAAAKAPRAYWGAYAVSKAALEMLVGVYAQEVAHSHMRVNLIDPGRTRTRMRQQAYPGENPDLQTHPDAITDCFVRLAAIDYAGNGEIVRAQA
jgi:NAD(P)-dependent dehydrogenase (short-subunit alcohol dehydrogenase family)